MNKTVLITGANRGIGLALTREYLSHGGYRVFAAARKPEEATQLHALQKEHPGRLEIVKLDVTDTTSARQAAATVAAREGVIDVLINNAAVGDVKDGTLEELDPDAMVRLLEINVCGPLRVTKAMLDLLRQSSGAKVVNITSGLGAVSTRAGCDSLAYGSSKAALNYVTRSLAFDLQRYGMIVAAITPGWVRTDMGGPKAPLEAKDSAAGIVKVIEGLRPADNSLWFTYDGKQVRDW